MPVTREQAQQLASLARAIRPHGARRWDEAGVMAQIAKVAHLHLADVALAVIRAADDRDLETPGAIGNPKAPCWVEKRTRPQPVDPYDANRHCHVCGKGPHGDDEHEFVTATDWNRRLARDDAKLPIRQLAKESAP